MKVDSIKRDIQRSGSFQEQSMGLAKGSEAFVFNVLRKDLYSDPVGSLIREYTVNAQDEHRKHGKTDVPILIQAPNAMLPELHIRDFAGGLTEEQVFEFFGNYGASDKRDSNVAVGFFGLGCKSAFAYTDSYVVKSYKDGVEHTFNIYIDETEVGKVAKLSTEPTTEPNGVLIIVPVKSHDINTFQNKILSTVRYFKTKPILNGFSEVPEFEEKTPVIEGDDWKFFGNGKVTVIMGEIAYPLDRYSISDTESWENQLLSSDLHIHLNIGDVQVTASREALQMTPKTIAAVRAKLAEIKSVMVAETEKAFKNVKSLVEAKTLYASVIESYNGYSRIVRESGLKIEWNGEEINTSTIFLDRTFHTVMTFYKHRDKITVNSHDSLSCKEGVTWYFDDTDKKQVNYKRRAKTLFDNGDTREVVLIQTSDVKELEAKLGISVKELKSFNDVVPTMVTSVRNATGVDASKKAKHLSKVFVFKEGEAYATIASDSWEVKEVETDGGVYVPLHRFNPTLPRIYSRERLKEALTELRAAGIEVDFPIFGIKENGSTEGMVRLDEWITKKVKAEKQLAETFSKAMAWENNDGIPDVSRLPIEDLPDDSVAKRYAALFTETEEVHRTTYYRYLKVFRLAGVDAPQIDDTLSTEGKRFAEKYPLLTIVDSYRMNSPLVVEYIKEMDNKGAEISVS